MTPVSEAGAIHLQVTPDIFMLTLSEDGLDSTLRCDVYDNAQDNGETSTGQLHILL